MKNNMKQISRKALAVIVAVTLIVSCLTVSFSAFATAGAFSVPATSPAAPLYVGKTLALSELSVEVDGAFYQGDSADISWTWVEGTSATLKDDVLTGVKAGVTQFAVSDGNVTQNVYVIVNEEGDDVFNLVELDFDNEEDFVAEDWIVGYAGLASDGDFAHVKQGHFTTASYKVDDSIDFGTETVTVGQDEKTALKLAVKEADGFYARLGSTGAFYNYPAMDDFADVDLVANMAYQGNGEMYVSPFSFAGVAMRAKVNYDAAENGDAILKNFADAGKSYTFKMRAYGGLGYFTGTGDNVHAYGEWDQAAVFATSGLCGRNNTLDNALFAPTTADPDYVMTPDAPDADLTSKNVNFTLSGVDMNYALNGNDIFSVKSGATLIGDTLDFRFNQPYLAWSPAGKSLTYSGMQGFHFLNNAKVVGGGTFGFLNGQPGDNDKAYDGMASYGAGGFDACTLYVFDVAVAPMNIKKAAALPEFGNAEQDEPEIYDITVPVNARVDLSTYATDWEDVKTETYEICNDVLNIYADDEIELTNENVTINVTVDVAGAETEFDVFAPAIAIITPDTESNDYTLTIEDGWNMADLDTLKLIEGDVETIIFEPASDDGQSFKFTTENADTYEIEADTVGGMDYAFRVYTLGATKRTTEGAEAIRFLTAFPQVRKDGQGVIDVIPFGGGFVYGDDTILDLSGKVGALIIPSILAGDVALEDADMSTIADGYATVNGFKAQAVNIQNLRNANSMYSQAWVTLKLGDLVEAGVDKTELDYTVVPYVEYMIEGGGLGYIFGTEIKRNYAEIGEEEVVPGPTPVEEPEVPALESDALIYFSCEPIKVNGESLTSRIVKPGDVVEYEWNVYANDARNMWSCLPIFFYENEGLTYIEGSMNFNEAECKAFFTNNTDYAEWTEQTHCIDCGFDLDNPWNLDGKFTLGTFQCEVDAGFEGDTGLWLESGICAVFDIDETVYEPELLDGRSILRVVAE